MMRQILSRGFHTSRSALKFNKPLSSKEMIKSGGIASMFRLPIYQETNGLLQTYI